MKLSDGNELEMPPGFRFHPTDEELVMHYLCRKCTAQPIAVPIIVEIDLYKFDPWQLPAMACYGEKEWYFFSPSDRKYPNGSRPNRAAGNGYWKATGADKPIGKPNAVGIKKALVFYAGKANGGVKTNWIMHEYRLANVDRSAGKTKNLRLDDWVLCRIYNKKGTLEKQYPSVHKLSKFSEIEEQKPHVMAFDQSIAQPPLTLPPPSSSGSEPVLSPDLVCDKEVQSEPKWNDIERAFDFQVNYMDAFQDEFFSSPNQYNAQIQDMYTFMQKPF